MAFNRASPLFRFSLLIVLSMGLMIVDHKSTLLQTVRPFTSSLNITFELIAQAPRRAVMALDRYYPDDQLHQELVALQNKQVILESKLQRYEALVAENERLSALLSIFKRAEEQVLLTQIIDVGLEPFSHKVVVNSGLESGVYLGQVAVTPKGILGQVSEVGFRRSVITLITNSSHGLPVQIQRNGLRTIVQGSGISDTITAPFLTRRADVQIGDQLVTSGTGGRFPVGYRVGEVFEIVNDANEAFLSVHAETIAKIDYTNEVLLLWNKDTSREFSSMHQDDPDE